MKYKDQLLKGKIIKRYKRFLADIVLNRTNFDHPTKELTAYICNTGSMKTCWEPNQNILLSFHDNPKRKLKYQVELIHNTQTWIGINTGLTNKIVIEAIQNKQIKELAGFKYLKPEIKLEKSRLDILLHNRDLEFLESDPSSFCFVEIKNVTLKQEEGIASFPDSVSTRGQKHLKELIELKKKGHRAVMFYLVQREDVTTFTPASNIDKEYAVLLKLAINQGVEVLVYRCKLGPKEITIDCPLPLIL